MNGIFKMLILAIALILLPFMFQKDISKLARFTYLGVLSLGILFISTIILFIYKYKNNEISEFKLNYINNRLGTNLNYNDLRKLKIILNLYDVIEENHINKLTRERFIVDQLNINFFYYIN